MKKILIISLMLIGTHSFGKEIKHNVDVKDDTVIVDSKPWFILEKFKGAPGTMNYYVRDLKGKKLVFLQSDSYKDPKEVSSSNPTGQINYFVITFLEDELKSEMPMYLRQSKVAEYLVKMELMPNGLLTDDSEKDFIMVSGHRYEQKRTELGGNSTIIINNNNTTPSNGVNFHIGN